MGECSLNPHLLLLFFNRVSTQSDLFVAIDNQVHVASLRLPETLGKLLSESIQLNVVPVSDHFCSETLHAVEELFVCLHLVTGHILVEDVPQFGQNRALHDLGGLVWSRDPPFVQLFDKDLVLSAVHLELELLLWVCVWIQGQILFNFVSFADNGMSEDAFAEDRVEVIIVKKSGLLALDYVSYVFVC